MRTRLWRELAGHLATGVKVLCTIKYDCSFRQWEAHSILCDMSQGIRRFRTDGDASARSHWGLIGAVIHWVFSGRAFRPPIGNGCALCGEHRAGETFAVLYDDEICKTCVERAVTFFNTGGAINPTPGSEPRKGCRVCGGHPSERALFDGARGSICSDCAEWLSSVLQQQCGVRPAPGTV